MRSWGYHKLWHPPESSIPSVFTRSQNKVLPCFQRFEEWACRRSQHSYHAYLRTTSTNVGFSPEACPKDRGNGEEIWRAVSGSVWGNRTIDDAPWKTAPQDWFWYQEAPCHLWQTNEKGLGLPVEKERKAISARTAPLWRFLSQCHIVGLVHETSKG